MIAQEPLGAATSNSSTSLVVFGAATSLRPAAATESSMASSSSSPASPQAHSIVQSSSSASSMSPLLLLAPPPPSSIRVNFNFCNELDRNETVRLIKPKIDMSNYYVYVCPAVISVCFFSIIFNATLMSISRQSKLINKSPILLLSLNLAVTDLIASALNGLNILLVSYLQIVYQIPIDICSVLILELLRYSATLASALHLLALAFVHYRGTVNPLQYRSRIFYSQHLSRTINIISICCWLLPLTLMIVWFNSIPCQGFKPDKCDYLFLLGFAFRYMILIVFSVPLLLMSIIYVRIFLFISRHQKGFVFAASSASKMGKQVGATNQTPAALNGTGADLEVAAVAMAKRESSNNAGRFCPVCSLVRAGGQDGDDEELLEIESVTIVSEDSNESSGSEQELESGGSAQLRPAAVSLIHNDQDDSYTIKSKPAGASAAKTAGAKSNCNDRAETTTAATTTTTTTAIPLAASGAQIDNDPVLRNGRQPRGPDDAQGTAATSGLMQAKLNCERQAAREVAALDRPLADDAAPRTRQLSGVARPAAHQAECRDSDGGGGRRRGPLGHSDSDDSAGDATARPLLVALDEGGTPLRKHRAAGHSEAGDSLRELGRAPDMTGSEAGLKLERSTRSAGVKSTHNSHTSSASRRRPRTPAASKSAKGTGNGTVNGANGNSGNNNRPAPKPARTTTLLRCTCDNKLNESTVKQLRRSNTLATAGEIVDVATRQRLTTTAAAATTTTTTTTVTGATRNASTGQTTITKTATTSGTSKLDLEPSISSRLSGSASAATPATVAAASAATTAAGTIPNSSFRSGPGSGGGCDSEQDSGSSSSGGSGSSGASSGGGSCSSGANGKGCAEGPDGRPKRGAGRELASGPSSVRARLFELKSRKSNSLRVLSEAASMTVTTLTSGHPAHTNFSSASSSLNNHHHNHLNHRHQSNSLQSNHYKHHDHQPHKHHHRHHHHHHHHHHRHDNPHEPQRLNSKKNAVPPTNTKALVTTLLILGTYIISYLPAILFSALTCIDSVYCPFPLYTVPDRVRLLFGTMTMLLLVAKSIVDPLIYSYRMNEIQQAISRYMSKRRSKSSSRATSLYTNSQRLGPNRGQATQLTNFATSSFKLLTSTQASLRSPASRATSVRINQHQFDRPCQSVGSQQQQVAALPAAGESRIDEMDEDQNQFNERAPGERVAANSVHDATGLERISETIVSFSGDTTRRNNMANDKLESLEDALNNIPKSLDKLPSQPMTCDQACVKPTPGEPKATVKTATNS